MKKLILGVLLLSAFGANAADLTYITKADCDNGYSAIYSENIANEQEKIVIIHNNKAIAHKEGFDISSSVTELDGVKHLQEVIMMNNANNASYALVYEFFYNEPDNAVDKGVIQTTSNGVTQVVAQCNISTISPE
ncbi:hypothetical protein [Citrobacter portucalensis]|uniref:hypothetical protein n=1 Tax=Citrobacter portucalensis TaxID=1639133 RepID=UPI002B222169|nr:hypothetical protein [Citrobacter portucalensis]MEB0901999.1 hypothetical protein [Citrobacter portucalensis]